MRALMMSLAVAVYGCVGSVNVVIPDRATRFESQLLGTWEDSASRERAVVTQRGPRAYAIDYADEQGKRLSLLGVLGASRGHLVLDLQPAAPGLGAYADLVVRLHIPLILDSIGNSIHVATLERDSLDEYLRRYPRAIAHMRSADGFVLTANPQALQRFLASYIERPGVLSKPSTWRRL